MTQTIARWNDAVLWCSTCQSVYYSGLVTDDHRMRCSEGHDAVGPLTTGQEQEAERTQRINAWAGMVLWGEMYPQCPMCGEDPQRFVVRPGLDTISFDCENCDFSYTTQ